MANRYQLRSLQPKRLRCSITCDESRQLLSLPPQQVKKRKVVLDPLIKGGFCNGMSSDDPKYMSILRDKLSDSEDDDADKESEEIAERYAMIAVDHRKKYGNFELVAAGPIAAGNISGGRIFHLNYKAKNNDIPAAEVQTFFAEITKTKKDGITVQGNIFLGPSDKLPEKANTHGCLYCLSHNIHHHYFTITFQNGGLIFWKTLRSKVFRLIKYISKGSKKKTFNPKFKHPGIVYMGEKVDSTKPDFANAALRMFNLEQHTNFELVRIGSWARRGLSIGLVFHLNFEAKCKDEPEAPMHMFFAQVIQSAAFFFAHFCKCLGQSDSLPEEVELHGCQYCVPPRSPSNPCVRHPPGPGYLTGR